MFKFGIVTRELRASSPNIAMFTEPLDHRWELASTVPIYRNVVPGDLPLRVLTVPLVIGERIIGVLQVGSIVSVIEAMQRTLADRFDHRRPYRYQRGGAWLDGSPRTGHCLLWRM
jgi:hypothetical protein